MLPRRAVIVCALLAVIFAIQLCGAAGGKAKGGVEGTGDLSEVRKEKIFDLEKEGLGFGDF